MVKLAKNKMPNSRLFKGDFSKGLVEKCKKQCGEHWDNEEMYFVYDEIKKEFANSEFVKYSKCAGIIKIW